MRIPCKTNNSMKENFSTSSNPLIQSPNPSVLDTDNNGTFEQIMTNHKNGKDYPIHMKKELNGSADVSIRSRSNCPMSKV